MAKLIVILLVLVAAATAFTSPSVGSGARQRKPYIVLSANRDSNGGDFHQQVLQVFGTVTAAAILTVNAAGVSAADVYKVMDMGMPSYDKVSNVNSKAVDIEKVDPFANRQTSKPDKQSASAKPEKKASGGGMGNPLGFITNKEIKPKAERKAGKAAQLKASEDDTDGDKDSKKYVFVDTSLPSYSASPSGKR
eukprot:scaffold48121_cov47-Attheya_sp.AAC.4